MIFATILIICAIKFLALTWWAHRIKSASVGVLAIISACVTLGAVVIGGLR